MGPVRAKVKRTNAVDEELVRRGLLTALYGLDLQEPIPNFPLPLKSDDPELGIDLQSIFAGVYAGAGYRYRSDYRQPLPPPKLSQEKQQWVDAL